VVGVGSALVVVGVLVALVAPVVEQCEGDVAPDHADRGDHRADYEGHQSSVEVGHAEAADVDAHEPVAEDGSEQQGHGGEAEDVPLARCLLEEGVGVLLQQHPPEERDEPAQGEHLPSQPVSEPEVVAGVVGDDRDGDDVDHHCLGPDELADLLEGSGLHLRSHGVVVVRGVGHGDDSPFPCAGIEWHRRLCLQWRLPVRVGSNRWSTYITSSSCCFLPKDRKITGIQL